MTSRAPPWVSVGTGPRHTGVRGRIHHAVVAVRAYAYPGYQTLLITADAGGSNSALAPGKWSCNGSRIARVSRSASRTPPGVKWDRSNTGSSATLPRTGGRPLVDQGRWCSSLGYSHRRRPHRQAKLDGVCILSSVLMPMDRCFDARRLSWDWNYTILHADAQ